MREILDYLPVPLIQISPSSNVENEVFVSSQKPCLFPTATDISYSVYGVRLFTVYLSTLSVVVLWKMELSFLSLIQELVRTPSPVFTGSTQDISALLDLMLETVSFVG